MRTFLRLLSLSVATIGLILFTGCAEEPAPVDTEVTSNDGSEASSTEEPVVRDTLFHVVEKRRSGGELQPSSEISSFDGRPRMERTPVETMIIVEGNQTRSRSAYLLPEADFRQVQVGHRLEESTLRRWESTAVDHIPAPPPPPESPLRSRTGGAAENLVY